MTRMKSVRPSPAMAVALLALFVAMGGVGYAAATIGSAQIKNNSIRSKDIRNGQVTGRDVKESALGKVRSAARADTATRAGSAASADRAATAGNVGGLTADQLRLRCPAGKRRTFGLCMETAALGPTTLAAARADCDSRGGRLPMVGELLIIRDLPGVVWADGTASKYEFTSDATLPNVNDGRAHPEAIDRDGNRFGDASGATFHYRCLTQPVNG